MGLGGSSVTSIPQAPPSPALVIDIFLVRWTDGRVDKLLSKEQPALRQPTPLVFPSVRWGLSQRQPGLLCPSPRALRVAWPRAPLLRGRWPPPRLSVAVSTWTTAESARDGPLPGRQACLCPRPLSQGLRGTMAPRPARLHPGPVHGPREAARGTHSAVGTQARGPGMWTPSLFIRVTQLDPTGLSVQQRTVGGAPGENRGAQGRRSPSLASGTEVGGARGGVCLCWLPGPR